MNDLTGVTAGGLRSMTVRVFSSQMLFGLIGILCLAYSGFIDSLAKFRIRYIFAIRQVIYWYLTFKIIFGNGKRRKAVFF